MAKGNREEGVTKQRLELETVLPMVGYAISKSGGMGEEERGELALAAASLVSMEAILDFVSTITGGDELLRGGPDDVDAMRRIVGTALAARLEIEKVLAEAKGRFAKAAKPIMKEGLQ